MSRSRTLLTNVVSNIGMQVVSAGLPFFILPFMLHYWGANTYGLLVLAFSVQQFVQFLNGAITVTLMKFVSEIHETGDEHKLNAIINVLWVVAFLNNLFVSAVMIVVGLFGLDWLGIGPEMRDTARTVFMEMGVLGILAGSVMFVDGVMYGLQRIHENNMFRVWESILTAATALAVIRFNGSLPVYVLAINLYPIITRGLQLIYLRRLLPTFRLDPRRHWDLSQLRRLMGFSGFQITSQISDILLFSAQKLVVQRSLGATALTMYEVANKPNLLFLNFVNLPLSAILPACSAAHARGDKRFLERMLIMGTRVYMLLTMPAILALIVMMKEFITLWVGPEFLPSVPLAQLFLLSLFIGCPVKVFSHIMIGKPRVFEYGGAKLVYALLGIPASILLISQFGVISGGVVMVGFALLAEVPVCLYLMRSEGISVMHFLRSIAPVLAVLVIEWLLLSGAASLGWGRTWFELVLLSGSAIAIVTALFVALLLKKEERALVGIRV